ncbi:MAG: hypothetical protein HY881_15220 [Deltaproteobacteria bacterium]|nr:hypothetical protein [Deltaproteobacteria bacterium]
MNKNRYELLGSLLNEWKAKRQEYKIFCEDGILIEDEWANANPKVMFLLKETYRHFHIIRGEKGPEGTSNTFWRRMRMWTFIITEIFNDRTPDFASAIEIKEEPNRCIAYVNIKKHAERIEYNNEAYSVDEDIKKYAINDKDYLRRQIDIINPDIIVCCSTFKFCPYIFNEIEPISERLFKTGNKWLIDFEHPSQRRTYESNFNDLSNISRKLK